MLYCYIVGQRVVSNMRDPNTSTPPSSRRNKKIFSQKKKNFHKTPSPWAHLALKKLDRGEIVFNPVHSPTRLSSSLAVAVAGDSGERVDVAMSGTGCFPAGEMAAVARVCRDGAAAARLKTGSLLAILVASAVGICLPVALTGAFRGKAGYARGLLLVKCYAAGVILSTSLVHVLPDAHAALADCAVATRRPWRDFPFAGLFSLVGALLALLVDLSASSHLEAHGHHQHAEEGESPPPPPPTHQPYAPIPTTKKSPVFELSGEMSPKKRAHSDDTDRDDVALFGAKSAVRSDEVVVAPRVGCHGHHDVVEVGEEGGGGEEEEARRKQKMVSKVLEIGIVFHSVIIGVTMGMSQDVCAIRPLVVALSFHQVFEGMGLGGCIAQVSEIHLPDCFQLHRS